MEFVRWEKIIPNLVGENISAMFQSPPTSYDIPFIMVIYKSLLNPMKNPYLDHHPNENGENKSHVPNHQPVKHTTGPLVSSNSMRTLSRTTAWKNESWSWCLGVSMSAYPKHESFHDHNIYIYIHT